MSRAALLLAALLSLGARAPLQVSTSAQDGLTQRADPVQREWRVRAWALAPAVSEDLLAALASPAWMERDAALEALARGLAAGALDGETVAGLLPAVTALAEDSGAPDQARALAVLGSWPHAVALPDLATLARHPLPAVRLGLVRVLCRSGPQLTTRDRVALAGLLGDADVRVAAGALRAWAAVATADSDWSQVPGAAFDDLLRSLERGAASEPVLVSLAAATCEDRGRASQVEALRLRLHGTGDIAVIVDGWRWAGERDLMTRAARVASVREPALGEALFDHYRARLPGSAEGSESLLADVVLASDPMHLLGRTEAWEELSPAQREATARRVWWLLLGREVQWEEGVVERWLMAPGTDLRRQVVETLSTQDAAHSGGAVGRLLVRALQDDTPSTARLAFRSLAKAEDPRPWLGACRAYWLTLDSERRLELLSYLPRDVPLVPFRADLLELLSTGPPHPAVLAALAALGPDEELAGAVEAWLDTELARFIESSEPSLEQSCSALARAFVPLAGAHSQPRLERLLVETAPVSEQLAKFASASLGRTPTGRAALERQLDEELPTRIRIEAALALAGTAQDESHVAWLAERYSGLDWELRRRVLEVCGRGTGAASFELLRSIALAPGGGDAELRDSACWALVARGGAAVDVLSGLIESDESVELRAVAIRALGSVDDPRARTFLLDRLRELERAPADEAPGEPGADDFVELELFERAALIETLARVQPAPDWLVGAWLRRPREHAARDLGARFVGDKLAATEFRWRTELAFARAAAGGGQLPGALARSGDWARIDGRCLAELGGVALAAGQTAAQAGASSAGRSLLAAALVALAGEGPALDRAAVLLFTQRRAWLAAERAQDWPAVVVHARALLELRGRGAVSDVRWAAEFGEFDPGRAHDPEARLRSSAQHAEGRIDAAAAGR